MTNITYKLVDRVHFYFQLYKLYILQLSALLKHFMETINFN